MLRKTTIVVAGAVIALALVYGAVWLATALMIRNQAERWAEGERARGTTVTYGEPYFTGSALAVTVNFPTLAVKLPEIKGGWSWQSPLLGVTGRPWQPRTLVLAMSGLQTLTPPTPLRPLEITARNAAATLQLDVTGRLTDLHAEVAETAVHWLGGENPAMQIARGAATFTMSTTPDGAPSSHLALDLEGLGLPAGLPPPLSRTVRSAHLVADVHGPVGSGVLPQVLEAWRTAGGDIDLREITLDWPPLQVAGSGTVALDQSLQPVGAFTLRFGGFFEALDALVSEHVMRQQDASMARIVLGMLAKAPPGGGPSELTLAFTAQDGQLHVGPINLLAVPKVTWPETVKVP